MRRVRAYDAIITPLGIVDTVARVLGTCFTGGVLMSEEPSAGVTQAGVSKPTKRQCPACGSEEFSVIQYPADTAQIACENCDNRCLLVDLREASVDSRWFDE